MFGFWLAAGLLTAVLFMPWALISGDIRRLYRVAMWVAQMGVRLGGIRVKVEGLDQLDPRQTYIFLSNHASNLDPPLLLPLIPRRTSVLAKEEIFRIPILGKAMRLGRLVPMDRSSRQQSVESLRAAGDVLRDGISLTVFVEGTRSPDGRLLPFKKGPFYLAMETGLPVVPVTIAGTHEALRKGQFAIHPGVVRVVFHQPLDPREFVEKEKLMEEVRNRIASSLVL
jgi:1-acyl-sn-glycerol-3-phosphate acyltransferase